MDIIEKYKTEGVTFKDIGDVVRLKELANIIPFPFKDTYMKNDPDFYMNNLKECNTPVNSIHKKPWNINFKATFYKDGPLIFPTNLLYCFDHADDEYEKHDIYCDFFTEKNRLSARRIDTEFSPLEQFNNKKFVASIMLKILNTTILNPSTLREAIYNECKEATQFKPSLMVVVLKKLFNNTKNIKILDFSAGWGDRMIAAIALDVQEYHGYDPNIELIEGHQKIINTFNAQDKIKMTYLPFEPDTTIVNKNYFDCVFTSPPFFNFEVYSKDETQSIHANPTLKDWMRNFLFKSLKKSWDALNIGGYLVIHMTDVGKTKVCEPMCLYIQGNFKGAKYIGVVGSVGKAGKPRPLWIFQKIPVTNVKMADKCEKALNALYFK